MQGRRRESRRRERRRRMKRKGEWEGRVGREGLRRIKEIGEE